MRSRGGKKYEGFVRGGRGWKKEEINIGNESLGMLNVDDLFLQLLY